MLLILLRALTLALLLGGSVWAQSGNPPPVPGPPPGDMAIVWTKDSLLTVASAHPKVLVDFYADWCRPCREMEPSLAQLEKEGKIRVIRIDYDANRRLAVQYGVTEIPVLLAFKNGKQVLRMEGTTPLPVLRKAFD